jgi:hypothetical protein
MTLCLFNEIPHHEDVWRSGGTAPPLMTSKVDGDGLSVSRPATLTPVSHCVRVSVGPRAGGGGVQNSYSYRELNPGSPELFNRVTHWLGG